MFCLLLQMRSIGQGRTVHVDYRAGEILGYHLIRLSLYSELTNYHFRYTQPALDICSTRSAL